MVNGCRVLAARDPLAAVRLPCLRHVRAAVAAVLAVRLRIEAPGRADGDRATLTEPSQTIYFFFKKPQVSLTQWTPFILSTT